MDLTLILRLRLQINLDQSLLLETEGFWIEMHLGAVQMISS